MGGFLIRIWDATPPRAPLASRVTVYQRSADAVGSSTPFGRYTVRAVPTRVIAVLSSNGHFA